jgi:hypothetical protein
MRSFEHLTRKQLSDYSMGSIGEATYHEAGKHLLVCETCRAELPPPTSLQFRRALLNESERENERIIRDEPSGLYATISTLIDTLRRKPTLAWTGVALLFLFGLSFLMLFNGSWQPNSDRDVARSFETDRPLPKFNEDENRRPVQKETNVSVGGTANPKLSESSNNLPISKENRQTLITSPSNRPVKKASGKLPATEQENVAAIRGGSSTCGDQKFIGFEFASTSGMILLKWEKVPKALKYHLYISDEEEILVDEYETSQETSYVLKKSLDKGKVYKWKVVIELENGQTMIGVSQKFTSRDFQPSQKGTVKRLNAEIRCSSTN